MRIAIPAESRNGLESPICHYFGHCPVFIIVNVKEGHVRSIRAIDNPYSEDHKTCRTPGFIQNQRVDVIMVAGLGQKALDFFKQRGIRTVGTEAGTVHQAVNSFLAGRLGKVRPCDRCTHHPYDSNKLEE